MSLEKNRTDLEDALGLTEDEITFTLPNQQAVEAASAQWEFVRSLELSDEEFTLLQNVLTGIDMLNDKYITEFAIGDVNEGDILGLQRSYELAVGAVLYGVPGELYPPFSEYPAVFKALFGPFLGEWLYNHGATEAGMLDSTEALREAGTAEAYQEIARLVEEMARLEIELVEQIGFPVELATSIANELLPGRIEGTPLDFDVLDRELNFLASQRAAASLDSARSHRK
jgi:hypothetical protein